MDRDDVIGTLNDLIETCKDGQEGFRTCADAVKNPQLKGFFEQKAERCGGNVLAERIDGRDDGLGHTSSITFATRMNHGAVRADRRRRACIRRAALGW